MTSHASEAGQDPSAAPALTPFWRRVPEMLFSPGKIMEQLAGRPVWLAAFLLGVGLIVLATTLIPIEVYRESFRAIMLESGREMPEGVDSAALARRFGMIGAPIIWFLTIFLYASVATVTFAFVFGDEGRFKQYLAIVSHAFLIPALAGLALVPLRIMSGDIRMSLSLGSMLQGVLEPGYLLNLLRGLDLFVILALAVIAIGAGKVDRRRGWGSAFVSLLLFSLLLSGVFAFLQ